MLESSESFWRKAVEILSAPPFSKERRSFSWWHRAAELLENSAIPLADISDVCGFGSAESFRRDFRKLMGVPPIRYRERFGAAA